MVYRQRFKIFVSTLLILISFALFSLSGIHAVSGSEHQKRLSAERHMEYLIDNREAMLFQQKQRELKAALQAYFEKAIASGAIVGAGVSIVQGDSILLADGFGWRNQDTGAPVDGATVFRLGSLSKGFTGILAAGLVAEGKLHWEDRVRDCITDFQLGDRANTEKITLSHILSHTAGAPYHSYTNLIESGLPLTEIAERFGEVTPVAAPGAQYSYQNALFALSGEMMQAVTGQTINQLLENRIFRPLGMGTAVMDYESLARVENAAVPHVKWRKGWKPRKLNHSYYNAVAAGGINASALDMAKWMRFLLGHNPEVMSKQALENAFTPVIEIKGHAKYYHRWPGHQASYYGYGWRIHRFAESRDGRATTMRHHGGSVNNFRNEIALYPEADLGICVLMNTNSSLAKTVIPDLYEIIREVYDQPGEHLALNSVSGQETP